MGPGRFRGCKDGGAGDGAAAAAVWRRGWASARASARAAAAAAASLAPNEHGERYPMCGGACAGYPGREGGMARGGRGGGALPRSAVIHLTLDFDFRFRFGNRGNLVAYDVLSNKYS